MQEYIDTRTNEIVTAVQWEGSNVNEIRDFCYPRMEVRHYVDTGKLFISSKQTGYSNQIEIGAYIVRNSKGSTFKVFEKVFKVNYRLCTDQDNAIKDVKQLRFLLDERRKEVKELKEKYAKSQHLKDSSEYMRSISLSLTKLDESIMWLGVCLQCIGSPNPYPDSKNSNNVTVEKSELP